MSQIESPYVDEPSLPLVKFARNRAGKIVPYCEKHGAMLCFKHNIYRCNECKTSIHMNSLYSLLNNSGENRGVEG